LATAQITSAGVSTAGSTCTDANAADRSCSSSAAIESDDGTTLVSRYGWNVNADSGIGGNAVQGGTAKHTLTFDVTAVGGYRLDITTERKGDMNLLADAACLPSTADLGAVTGTSNAPLDSGTLNLPDPGTQAGVSTGTTTVDQSSSAVIFGVSNSAPQSHQLQFTWSGTVVSASCEAAVRLGEQNGTTQACSACEYPGSPARVLEDDGHVVTVTLVSLCGNGVVDPEVGEDCDFGAGNGSATACCTANCTFRSVGETCRPVAGPCDVADVCTGTSGTCPADTVAGPSTLCRAKRDFCDVDDFCDGSSAQCPSDAVVAAGIECRPVAGFCDAAEQCDGSPFCPPDAFDTGTPCRASAGACDPGETCDGSGPNCPADAKSTAECRAAADLCDAAELCDGVNNDCPPDVIAAAGTPCRVAGGVCDIAETCDGASTACPADVKSTAECRPAAGVCDLPETCDGVNDDCPSDAFAASNVECRPASGPCDAPEDCTGSAAACPADVLRPSGFECRPVNRPCDLPEVCSGDSHDCPADLDTDADGDTVCDPVDLCPIAADTDQADGDSDGVGDACDPCTNLYGVIAGKAKLKLTRQNTPPGDDGLLLQGTLEGLPTEPPVDPVVHGMRIMMERPEDSAASAFLDVTIPGGTGWTANSKGTSMRWQGDVSGISKVKLKSSAKRRDTVKLMVQGSNGTFTMLPEELPVKVTVSFSTPLAQDGECGEATFASPGCKLNRKGSTLSCR
jgi:hypothetical protein